MAYVTATFDRLERNADGRPVLVFVYTGDAGELPIEQPYPIDASTPPTLNYMRGLAMQRLEILNNSLDFIALVTPSIGIVLDTTTPLPTPPAPTFGAFMAASAPFTPGTTPQDVFTITGSATRTIEVWRMAIVTVQTAAGTNAWALVKRSTANTGGTSALVPGVPTNDTFPAATATVRQYTANPTAGNLVGAAWTGRVAAPVPSSALAGPFDRVVDLVPRSVTLTGTADVLAWNFGGVALPAGLSVQASVWWTER